MQRRFCFGCIAVLYLSVALWGQARTAADGAVAPLASIRVSGCSLRAFFDSGKCCHPAFEEPPPIPKEKDNCKGKVWSVAVPGFCSERKEKSCNTGGKTVVEIKEYQLVWKGENSCIGEPTGRTHLMEVDTCWGNSCE